MTSDINEIKQAIWRDAGNDLARVNKSIAAVSHKDDSPGWWRRVHNHILLNPPKKKAKKPKQEINSSTWNRYVEAYRKYQADNFPNWVRAGHTLDPRPLDLGKSNDLTTLIENFLTWAGHFANRTGNEGRVLPDGTRIPSRSKSGMQDIDANLTHPKHPFGIPWKIEVKVGKDKLGDKQVKFGKLVAKTGARYSVVKTAEDFFKQYDELLK